MATLVLPPYSHECGHVGISFLLLVAIAVLGVLTFGRSSWQAIPPFAFFVVVLILREGTGGVTSGLGSLVMLPVLWVAMYGTRIQVWLGVLATGAVFLLPIWLRGAPEYPTSDGRRALVWALVAATVGPAVHGLVPRLHGREQQHAELASSLQEALRELTVTEHRWRVLLEHLPDTTVLTVGPDMRYGVALGGGLKKQARVMSRARRCTRPPPLRTPCVLNPFIGLPSPGASRASCSTPVMPT